MKGSGGERVTIAIGLISTGQDSSSVLAQCQLRIQQFLETALPDFVWRLESEEWRGGERDSLSLLDEAQSRMAGKKWDFCFVVVDWEPYETLPGELGLVSLSHSTALVYLRRLAPDNDSGDMETLIRHCTRLIMVYFAYFNGLVKLERTDMEPGDLDDLRPFDEKELEELNSSLNNMARGAIRRRVKEITGLALYVRVLVTRPMRILRAVFHHRPWSMVFSLGRLVFAAMAALALALLSAELWQLGVGINLWRSCLIAAAVLLLGTTYVVFKQRIMVRGVSLSGSERAAFFNLTSFLTIFSVFLMLFVVIFAISNLAVFAIYPRYIVKEWLGVANLGLADYLKVSLMVSSLVMIVGALGAGLEENRRFRQVMYTERNR